MSRQTAPKRPKKPINDRVLVRDFLMEITAFLLVSGIIWASNFAGTLALMWAIQPAGGVSLVAASGIAALFAIGPALLIVDLSRGR